MLRTALFAVALCATTTLAVPQAKPPALNGSWLISYAPAANPVDVNLWIVKIDAAGAKPGAEIVAVPGKNPTPAIKSFEVVGKQVNITLATGLSFSGVIGTDNDLILGSFGNDSVQFRGKMVRTDVDTIAVATTPRKLPEEMTQAQQLTNRPLTLRNQARVQKDAEKKKELLADTEKAQKEADEKVPALYRKVIATSATDAVAIDAALSLLKSASKWKVDASEAKKLVEIIEKQASLYGPKYSTIVSLEAADALTAAKGLESLALSLIQARATSISERDPLDTQTRILTLYKSALEGAGKLAEVKAVDLQLATIEKKLDDEYHASVPPFKPEPFAGRKESGATQVAVMELFTGAQCPPCVAADVAFDALGKAYKPSDLILIQYHMHIPGPDPLTNPVSVGRWDYYRERFPKAVGGTPTTIFNGKPLAGGGGGMANAEKKFEQYRTIIDPLLEKTTAVKVKGTAKKNGEKVEVSVEVDGAPTEGEFKLRILLVEENIKYVGSNKLRFHHQVVRAMPGGVDGTAIKEATFKKTVSSDLAEVRSGLVKYLDDYAANERPFPYKSRPLDLKHLRAIALVQDDKTGEVLQAVMMDVEEKAIGGE